MPVDKLNQNILIHGIVGMSPLGPQNDGQSGVYWNWQNLHLHFFKYPFWPTQRASPAQRMLAIMFDIEFSSWCTGYDFDSAGFWFVLTYGGLNPRDCMTYLHYTIDQSGIEKMDSLIKHSNTRNIIRRLFKD